MSKCKNPKISGENELSLVRSSAAEYLTFVAAGGGSEASVEMRYEDENIWLTQKMMATLYDVSVPAINQHLKRIFADAELTREVTVKQYLIVQTEGSREVRREVEHYSLQAIIAVGFKIENELAVQFRKWANQIVTFQTRRNLSQVSSSNTAPLGLQPLRCRVFAGGLKSSRSWRRGDPGFCLPPAEFRTSASAD